MPKKVVSWYIYPLSSETNARVAEMLDSGKSMTEIMCADRKRRPVWECSREVVDMLRNSRIGSGFEFKVYRKEANGRIVRDMGKSKSTDKALTQKLLKTMRRPKNTASK
ncbi:MAG: hypothetical protein ACYCY6_01765 [Minisyncoccota bacterium]